MGVLCTLTGAVCPGSAVIRRIYPGIQSLGMQQGNISYLCNAVFAILSRFNLLGNKSRINSFKAIFGVFIKRIMQLLSSARMTFYGFLEYFGNFFIVATNCKNSGCVIWGM